MTEPTPPSGVEKLVVRSVHGRWRLLHGPKAAETFADSAAAIVAACCAARAIAQDGRLALVLAETVPQELHCFMPRPDLDAGPQPLATCLRLVALRD